MWTLGFVGCGVMAEVMIAGLLEEGLLPPEKIIASNRRTSRGATLQEQYGIQTTTDNQEIVSKADVVVLSVKPQNLAGVLSGLKGTLSADTMVLSIVAGAMAARDDLHGGLSRRPGRRNSGGPQRR